MNGLTVVFWILLLVFILYLCGATTVEGYRYGGNGGYGGFGSYGGYGGYSRRGRYRGYWPYYYRYPYYGYRSSYSRYRKPSYYGGNYYRYW